MRACVQPGMRAGRHAGGHAGRHAGGHAGMHACLPVSEKNTPAEKKTLGDTSSKTIKSGAGEQFMLLLCKAEARRKKECFFTDAGMLNCGLCCSRQRHARMPALRSLKGGGKLLHYDY